MTKLHINISAGIVEVEGEPDFVREIYDDFKKEITKRAVIVDAPAQSETKALPSLAANADEKVKPPKKSSTGKKASYSHLKNLATGLPDQDSSLGSYIKKYMPKTNIQRNVVIVHYLTDQHSSEKITLDHIFTCYANANLDLPKALYESVADTSSAVKGYGYLDASDVGEIKIVHKGHVLLQELEKKAASVQ